MSAELSGRELEIAVAKALGWTLRYDTVMSDDDAPQLISGWVAVMPNGKVCMTGLCDTEDLAWKWGSPKPLTKADDFVVVLAALDGEPCDWSSHKGQSGYDTAIWKQTPEGQWEDPVFFRGYGATYQEATCRAFVAWKAA